MPLKVDLGIVATNLPRWAFPGAFMLLGSGLRQRAETRRQAQARREARGRDVEQQP